MWVQQVLRCADSEFVFSTHVIPAASLGLSARRSFHLAGQVPKSPRLAVVGSRAAHRRFVRACHPIAEAARELGWSLISGGALGIDAAAHRAAIDVGLPQVAVLPCGSDQIYPPGNRRLMAEILEQPDSGILFAHPPGTKTVRAMFASRNAVVVGLADAVVVVEAAMRSGSTLTGRLARRSKTRLAAIVGSD
ncbi:MAG: DNA-processing protein DprA, partial [Nannocystaceae bacterium]